MKFVPSSQPPNSHFLSDVIISICSSHKTKPLPLWILLLSRLHWQPQVTLAWLPRSCACVCWIFLLRVGKESLVINWVCQCCLVCFVSSVSLKANLTVVVVLCVCVCVSVHLYNYKFVIKTHMKIAGLVLCTVCIYMQKYTFLFPQPLCCEQVCICAKALLIFFMCIVNYYLFKIIL